MRSIQALSVPIQKPTADISHQAYNRSQACLTLKIRGNCRFHLPMVSGKALKSIMNPKYFCRSFWRIPPFIPYSKMCSTPKSFFKFYCLCKVE